MIDHERKCIFIHVPRCAGTSIEQWICGEDWWEIEPSTKHLIASQARAAYADFWDEYFKFSIVRSPYSRVLSMLKYYEYFGLLPMADGTIDFSGYETLFGADIILEHDHRFVSRDEILRPKHQPNQIFGNILDEQLDFIGKFETLNADMALVRSRLGIDTVFDVHLERSEEGQRTALSASDREWIAAAYANDIAAYDYDDDYDA